MSIQAVINYANQQRRPPVPTDLILEGPLLIPPKDLYEYPDSFENLQGFSIQEVLLRCKFTNGQRLSSIDNTSKWYKAHCYWIRNAQTDEQWARFAREAPGETEQLRRYLFAAHRQHIIDTSPPTPEWMNRDICGCLDHCTVQKVMLVFLLVAATITVIALAARGKFK